MYYKYSNLFYKDSIKKQIIIEYDGGTITNNELYSESFELTESLCSEEQLKFGTCEAGMVKFKIANIRKSLKNKWLTISMVVNEKDDEPLKLGKYKVYSDTPSADRNYREIVAYDAMYDIINADITEFYNGAVTEGSLALNTITSLLQNLKIPYKSTLASLPNWHITTDSTADSLSGKDLLSAFCEVNGCFARIDRNGKFEFVKLGDIVNPVYPEDYLYPSDSLYPSTGEESGISEYGYDGGCRIENGYLYTKIKGNTIIRDSDGVETELYGVGYREVYDIRISVPENASRLCIYAGCGCYAERDDEKFYAPYFYWLDENLMRTNNPEITIDVDVDADGSYSMSGTLFCRTYAPENDDGQYGIRCISGVPVFDVYEYLLSYLNTGDLTGCVNYVGFNDIDKSSYISCKYEDFDVKSIESILIRNSEDDAGALVGKQGGNCYIIDDNFLTNGKSYAELEYLAKNLYDSVKGISYVPFEAELPGKPHIKTGEKIRIIAKNKTIESYVLKRTLRGIQALRDTYSTNGKEYYGESVNSVGKSIIQLKKRTNTLTRNLDETISEIYVLDEKGEKVSKIQQNAELIAAEVTRATGEETKLSARIEVTEKGIESKVEKGEIISTINQSAETVAISAEKINLNGAITANGNVNIGTDGKITAKGANVNGTIEATTLKAQKAYYIVDFDFGVAIKVIEYVADNTSDTIYRFGRLTANDYGSGLNYIAFKDESQDRTIVFNTDNINFNGAEIVSDLKLGVCKILGGDGNNALLYCESSNTYVGTKTDLAGYTTNLRGETVRLTGKKGVYLGSSGSTAVSSDENLKELFEIDERYEKFYDLLEPTLYRYKEDGHRKHVGIGARHVKECLDEAGINTEDFAGLIIETDVTIGEEDNRRHYDELYSIRYEEFIMLNMMKNKKLEKRIESLENELAEQKKLIQALMEKIDS